MDKKVENLVGLIRSAMWYHGRGYFGTFGACIFCGHKVHLSDDPEMAEGHELNCPAVAALESFDQKPKEELPTYRQLELE